MTRAARAAKVPVADRSSLVKKLVIIVIALPALIYAILAVGISTTTALVSPDLSLRWNPYNNDALSSASFAIIEADTSAAALAKAEGVAIRSFERSPLSPAAVRTLAYVADMRGQPDRALALMRFSLRLTRRDFPTHLWFIEHYVGKDDLPNALNHYDMALRTSALAHPVLMPILIKATEDSRLIRPLAKVLDRRPVWKDDFIRDVISKGPSALNVALLSEYVAASGNPFSAVRIDNLTDRLVAEGQFTRAAKLAKRDYQNQLVANGGFETAIGSSPFDWKLTSDFDLGAAVSSQGKTGPDLQPGRSGELQIDAAAGRGGEIASQLLLLSPGRYRLTADWSAAASDAGGSAFWTVTCATGEKQVILTIDVTKTNQQNRDAEFDVAGAGCPAQRLSLSVRSASDTQGYSGSVDNVTVSKVAAAGRI